jgi:hypothetical protein
MRIAVTAATIDQFIESDFFGEELEAKILKQPEQDRGTSPRLRDRIGFGLDPQDISSKEGIQSSELSSRPFVRVQWVPRREFDTSSLKTASPTTDERLAPIVKNPTLQFQWRQILERFDVIARRENNWDERESKKPNELALSNAKNLMKEMLDAVISEGQPWLMPFISSDEDGYITAAWHNGEHELHLDITETEVEYTKVWGIKIDTEMHEGVLKSNNYLELWEWLLDA